MPKPKREITIAASIIGTFVLAVSAVESVNTLLRWIGMVSSFLFEKLGETGTNIASLASIIVGVFSTVALCNTPQWLYKATPERLIPIVSWTLIALIVSSLLVLIPLGIGMWMDVLNGD